MDIISDNWLSELEMDDDECNIFHQYQINNMNFDDFNIQDMTPTHPLMEVAENLMINQSFSADSHSSETCNTSFERRPAKQPKTSSWNHCLSSSQILSFADGCKFDAGTEQETGTDSKPDENIKNVPKSGQGIKRARETTSNVKSPSYAQDHIMAERRRREKLSQRFIALSAIVPGLKKMDKATVLGDAIKYLKQLQDRVNKLEEQTKKRTIESVVFVNRSQINAGFKTDHEDTSSSDENPDVLINESLPEIEARVFEKNVLVRIHCENTNGVIAKVVSEIEKHHLCVQNSSSMPFGNHALDITILAQMETEFCMTVKDLVKTIRSAFPKFMR